MTARATVRLRSGASHAAHAHGFAGAAGAATGGAGRPRLRAMPLMRLAVALAAQELHQSCAGH